MAELTLSCGHPGIVSHERGQRRVPCAVPGCNGFDVIVAHASTTVVYERIVKPAGPGNFSSGLVTYADVE